MPETLSWILDPLTLSEFCSKYYSKKSLHIAKSPHKFESLFDWGSLNNILNRSPIPHPTMKMVLEGKPIVVTNANSVIDQCREGASLVIEEIHKYDDRVGELAANLAKEMREPVRVNMYLSQPSRQGYNRHYDTHDVFILQVAGFKGWRVYDYTVEFPLFVQKFHKFQPPTEPRLECVLEPGDVLYIPRGHWHEATAQIEPSMHLTVGIYARTGIDFMTWLTDELREDVRCRETFPLVFNNQIKDFNETPDTTIEHFERLRQVFISKLNDPSLLNNYLKFCVAQERKLKPFNFPEQVLQSTTSSEHIRFCRAQYQRVFLERNSENGNIEITVWGKVLKFSSLVESLLLFIFSNTNFTKTDLINSSPSLSWNDIVIVLDCLIQQEILKVVKE